MLNLKDARNLFVQHFSDPRAQKGRKKAVENVNFYAGNQWADKDRKKLEDTGRVPIVINHSLRQVNSVTGLHIQNQTDLSVLPVEGGDEKTADVLEKIIKNIETNSKFEFTDTDVFFDTVVTDNGWFLVRPDWTNDIIDGEILIDRIKPERMFWDHDSEKYDLSDAECVGYWEWMTPNQIKANYPKVKRVIIPESAQAIDESPPVSNVDEKGIGTEMYETDYDKNGRPAQDADTLLHLFYQRETKKLRVIHLFHVERERKFFLLNTETREIMPFDDQSATEREAIVELAKSKGMEVEIIERSLPVTRYVCFTLQQILQRDDEYPYCVPGTYPTVPQFNWFRDGRTLAFLDPLMDPNRECNKRRVQGLYLMSASGFVYTEGAVKNEEEVRQFGQRPDIHIILDPDAEIGKNFQRWEPTAIPEIVQFEAMAVNDIMSIGVNPELLGLSGPNQQQPLGVVTELKQKAGMVGLEMLFLNRKRTRMLLAKQIIHLIQTMWTTEKVIRLISKGKQGEQVTINQPGLMQDQNGEPMVDAATGEAIQVILNDVTVGRYDVAIDESPKTPTKMHKSFAEAIELGKLIAQAGAPMPVQSMVKLSDFPNKDEMIQEIQQIGEQQHQMELLKFGAQAKTKGE